MLFLGIIYTIYNFSFTDTSQTPDDLKLSLSLIETALGVFLGLIVETLFGKIERIPTDGVSGNIGSPPASRV